MKRLLIFLLLPLFALPQTPPAAARAAGASYALIGEECYLLRNAADGATVANTYFLLPENYFVEIVSESGAFYFVNYDDLKGYVAKDSVTTVSYTPKSKYPANLTLALNADGNPVNVRSLPNASKDYIIGAIPAETDTVPYYNHTRGEAISGTADQWYYVRYTQGGTVLRGYVYATYVTASAIPENDTSASADPIIDDPVITPPNKGISDDTLKIIIIVALAIPALFILYLLFRKKQT